MFDCNLAYLASIVNNSSQANESYRHHHHHSLMMIANRSLVARKLGLPEVILPSDVRNDLYINLVGGEYSRYHLKYEHVYFLIF